MFGYYYWLLQCAGHFSHIDQVQTEMAPIRGALKYSIVRCFLSLVLKGVSSDPLDTPLVKRLVFCLRRNWRRNRNQSHNTVGTENLVKTKLSEEEWEALIWI